MPFVRIDLPRGKSAEQKRAIADVVYDSLRATMNVPEDDRFQVIAEHGPDGLLIDPSYMGIARSAGALLIQVTLSAGRTVEMKQAFYKAVADGLHVRAGVRPEDVMINLVEVTRADWSFGNGVAQYVEMDKAKA
jgi:4-oxalocrotonate tautomerase